MGQSTITARLLRSLKIPKVNQMTKKKNDQQRFTNIKQNTKE